MKVTCQTCQAKYTIADEKVAGKVVKIKCKKCSSTIVVNGAGAPPPSIHPPGEMDDEEGEGETKIFVDPTGAHGQAVDAATAAAAAAASADEWTVNVTDDDQRTMTTPQIAKEIGGGVVTADTYVWKDGMADWLPVSDVPELASFLASAPASPPSGPADLGFGAAAPVIAKSPVVSPKAAVVPAVAVAAAASSGAARRAGARPAVDLFGASKEPAAAAVPPPAASSAASGHVGERNENSVLFSLSALTATENAAKASARKSDHAVLDMGSGPPKPKAKNGGRGNFDDIMNLGGGGIGGGMASAALAPPPLLAPVVEAPVRPSIPVPGVAPRGTTSFAPGPISTKKKGGMGVFVVILLVLVAAGGGAFVYLKGSSKAAPEPLASATPDSTSASTATAAPTAAPADSATAAPVATTTPSATPDATAAPSGVAAATSAAPAAGAKLGGPLPSATPSTKPAVAPTPAPTPDPAPAPASGGAEFSRSAAASALGGAAGAAKGCKKADGPTGSGRVKVTFAPSGNVTTATVDGPPFAGTSMGGCIAGAFRGAHVPPFDGSPVTVTKSFSIN